MKFGNARRLIEARMEPGLIGTLVYDEIHRFRTTSALQMNMLLKLGAERCLMLSASPFMSRLRDFGIILHIVDNFAGNLTRQKQVHEPLTVKQYEDIAQRIQKAGGNWACCEMLDADECDTIGQCLDVISY